MAVRALASDPTRIRKRKRLRKHSLVSVFGTLSDYAALQECSVCKRDDVFAKETASLVAKWR